MKLKWSLARMGRQGRHVELQVAVSAIFISLVAIVAALVVFT